MTRCKPMPTLFAALALLLGAVRIDAVGAETMAESASYVVLASTVPAFAVGTLVDDDTLLEVPEGASLSLIDAGGAIRVIDGPFLGRLRSDADEDQDDPDFLSDLASIIAVADVEYRPAPGMGRSSALGDAAAARDPWLVAFDTAMAEDLCVSPAGELVFLRAEPGNPPRVRFATADGSEEVVVEWPAGDPLLHWPAAMPPADGGRYVIDPGSAPAPQMVTMHLMPEAMDSNHARAAVWLARSGCATQAEAMVRRLALGG